VAAASPETAKPAFAVKKGLPKVPTKVPKVVAKMTPKAAPAPATAAAPIASAQEGAAAPTNTAEDMRKRMALKLAQKKQAVPVAEAQPGSKRQRPASSTEDEGEAVPEAAVAAAPEPSSATEHARAPKRIRSEADAGEAAEEMPEESVSAVPEADDAMPMEESEVPTVDDDTDAAAGDVEDTSEMYDEGPLDDADVGEDPAMELEEDGEDDAGEAVDGDGDGDGDDVSASVPDIETDEAAESVPEGGSAETRGPGSSRAARPGAMVSLAASVPDMGLDEAEQVPSTPVLGVVVDPAGQQVPTRSRSSLNTASSATPFGEPASAAEVPIADDAEVDYDEAR
jgi:hypothetical protein